MLLFRDFIPSLFTLRLEETERWFNNGIILTLIFTLWVAFSLYSSVNWIVQLYEGYKFPTKLQKRMVSSLKKKWHSKKTVRYRKVYRIVKRGISEKNIDLLDKHKAAAIAELQDLEISGPIDGELLLPTRLGNVLRASEIYPIERYHLEGITIWPRLFHVLPPQFVKDLEEKNNHFIFLINSSLMSYIIGAFSSAVGLIRSPCQLFISVLSCHDPHNPEWFFTRGFQSISPFEYLWIGIVFIFTGYFLYRIAVNAAVSYGLFIRAGFDLYRFDLLKQLKHPIPRTLKEEKEIWDTLCEFFIAGNRLGFNDFQFNYVSVTEGVVAEDIDLSHAEIVLKKESEEQIQ